jgi:hypothetical protein
MLKKKFSLKPLVKIKIEKDDKKNEIEEKKENKINEVKKLDIDLIDNTTLTLTSLVPTTIFKELLPMNPPEKSNKPKFLPILSSVNNQIEIFKSDKLLSIQSVGLKEVISSHVSPYLFIWKTAYELYESLHKNEDSNIVLVHPFYKKKSDLRKLQKKKDFSKKIFDFSTPSPDEMTILRRNQKITVAVHHIAYKKSQKCEKIKNDSELKTIKKEGQNIVVRIGIENIKYKEPLLLSLSSSLLSIVDFSKIDYIIFFLFSVHWVLVNSLNLRNEQILKQSFSLLLYYSYFFS